MQRPTFLAATLGAVLLALAAHASTATARAAQTIPIESATTIPVDSAGTIPIHNATITPIHNAERATICHTGHLVSRPRLPLESVYGTWTLEKYGDVSTNTNGYTGERTMVMAPDSSGGSLRISPNGTYYWRDGFGVVTSGRIGYFESGNCGLGKDMTHFAFQSALRTVYIMREPDGGVLIDSVPGELYQYESKRR